jgi:hypothetical protein
MTAVGHFRPEGHNITNDRAAPELQSCRSRPIGDSGSSSPKITVSHFVLDPSGCLRLGLKITTISATTIPPRHRSSQADFDSLKKPNAKISANKSAIVRIPRSAFSICPSLHSRMDRFVDNRQSGS